MTDAFVYPDHFIVDKSINRERFRILGSLLIIVFGSKLLLVCLYASCSSSHSNIREIYHVFEKD